MDKSGVYKIVNVLNNRIYIGSASFLSKRKRTHFSSLKHNSHRNIFLQHDYNKCGANNFIFEVIEYCPVKKLIETEQKYLDKYYDNQKQCYNITPKAEHSRLGTKLTDEQKERLSRAHKGQVAWNKGKALSLETKEKLSKALKGKTAGKNNSNFGKHLSKETKERLRKAMTGRKASNETKQKLRNKARRGKNNNKARAVRMFNKDGNYIKQYETIIEAIKDNNLPCGAHSNISACCSGRKKTAYKFIWRYAETFSLDQN